MGDSSRRTPTRRFLQFPICHAESRRAAEILFKPATNKQTNKQAKKNK